MYVQAPVMHQLPGHQHPFFHRMPPPLPSHHMADSPSTSGASSQQHSPNRTPPLSAGGTSFYLPAMPMFQPPMSVAADSGYASHLGSLTSSPVSTASAEHHQHHQQHMPGDHMVMQQSVQPLLMPFGLPIQFAAAAAAVAAAAAAANGGGPPQFSLPPPMLLAAPPPTSANQAAAAAAAAAFLHQQHQQQQLAGCPVFKHELPENCRLHAAAAFRAYNFGSHVPPFDLVKWYSEKPPFILDGRTACLYKMREIDRKLPTSMVLSADAEYNTVLAEYYILRNMFGPEYSLHDNVFIKLNRSKEGELAKFIHIFFRERQDAEVYMANAHKFGALTPAWSNPRAFSKQNVYITSVPYYLLSKESLCGYVREFVLGKGAATGTADPIKRARVDAEKRSAQVEFHRSEDAEALIAYFYQHIPEANARPAFDNVKEQRASESAAPATEN